MPAINSKPTSEELDQAKEIYSDVNDYLEYLSELIQTKVQELPDDEEDSDDEELSPIVSQFLNEYQEYISSLPQVHTQILGSNSSASSSSSSSCSSRKSSYILKQFLKYSKTYQTLQLLSPDLLCHQKLCDSKLDLDARVFPLFSTSFPTFDQLGNGKLLTNGTSSSVALLKAQLEKNTIKQKKQETNYLTIHSPTYSPLEEEQTKNFVFVVKESTDVVVAPRKEQKPNYLVIRPPTCSSIEEEQEKKFVFVVKESTDIVVAPRKEQEPNYLTINSPTCSPIEEGQEKNFVFVVKESTDAVVVPEPSIQQKQISTVEDEKSEVISEKKVKTSTIDFDFLSSFLSINKFGFSKSQLRQLRRTFAWA